MILRNVLSQFFIVKCFSKSLLVRIIIIIIVIIIIIIIIIIICNVLVFIYLFIFNFKLLGLLTLLLTTYSIHNTPNDMRK